MPTNITVTDATGTLKIDCNGGNVHNPDKLKVFVRAISDGTVQIWWSETQYVSDNFQNYVIGVAGYASAPLAAAAIAAMLNTGASTSNNVKTVAYVIGLAGIAGCDYNFTAPANTTKQSIQLGATTIVPANSPVTEIVEKCVTGVVGGTTTADLGLNSGTDEYVSEVDLSTTDEINSASATVVASASAASVWFSITPSANWSTLSAGKWKVWVTINDNSKL